MPSKKFNWVQMIPTGVVLAVAGFLVTQIFGIQKDYSEARITDAERYYDLSRRLSLCDFKIDTMKSRISKLERENNDEEISGVWFDDGLCVHSVPPSFFSASNRRIGDFIGDR